jgi:hypothetical protein
MLSLAVFGGNRVDGSMLDPGERLTAIALFGGIDFDFASVPPPPAAEVVIVAVFGGASVKVRARQAVRLSGLSIFGGRSIDPARQIAPPTASASQLDDDADLDLPLEINAYALFGGVNVKRVDEPVKPTTGVPR